MKPRKLIIGAAFLLAAICACFAYTIYVSISYTYSQPVPGGGWLTGDGGTVDLEGDDPSDPASYTTRGTTMPTGTRNITIEVPGNHPPDEAELQEKIQEKVDEVYREIWKDHQNGSNTLPRCHEVTADSVVVMYGHSTEVRDASKVDINPPKPGDPVNIANGAFYYDDSDLVLTTGLNSYSVGRWHAAGRNTGSLLGSLWYSGLDTRIVRGRKANAESEVVTLEKLYAVIRTSATKAAVALVDLEIYFQAGLNESDRLISVLESQINSLNASDYRDRPEVRKAVTDTQSYLGDATKRKIWFQVIGAKALTDARNKSAELSAMKAEAEKLYIRSKQELALARSLDSLTAPALRGSGFSDLRELGNDILIHFDEQGQKRLYRITAPPDLANPSRPWPAGSDCEAVDPVDTTVVRLEADGRITVRLSDLSVRVYSANGLPERTENQSGDAILWRYSDTPDGPRLSTLHYRGRDLARLEYNDDGRLSSLRGPENTGADFQYNAGELHAVTAAGGGRIEYRYRGGSIASVRKADSAEVRITHGLVRPGGTALATAVTGETGKVEKYDYDLTLRTAVYTDQSGRQTFWQLDKNWLEIFRLDPDGRAVETRRDEHGTILSRTWNGGRTVRYEHDSKGRLTAERFPDGTTNRIERNSSGLPVRMIDRDGVATELVRDAHGRITAERRGGVLLLRRDYLGDGRPVREHLAGGAVREYRWLADGFIESVITREADGSSFSEQYRYDGAGRIISRTDAAGGVYEWRHAPSSTTEITPAGLVTVYNLNERQDVESVIRRDSATGETRTRQWTWDGRHLPLEIRDDLGTASRLKWSDCGRLTALHEGALITRREFGSDGRMIRETRGAGSTDEAARRWSYRLEGSTLITACTDSTGAVTRTVHDSEGRLVSFTDAAGGLTRREWTPAGRLLRETSPSGAVSEFRYDSAGRLTQHTRTGHSVEHWVYGTTLFPELYIDGAEQRFRLRHDSRGNLLEQSGPEAIIVHRYDGLDRRIRSENHASGVWTEWEFSDGGRTQIENRGGLVKMTVQLNAFGEPVRFTDGEGRTETQERDLRGRVIRRIDGYGNKTEFKWDSSNRITEVVSPEGRTDRYEYNGRGLLAAVQRAGGMRQEWMYDTEDRLTGQLLAAGRRRLYTRDSLGRITSERSSVDGEAHLSFVYSPDRRTITRTDGNGRQAVERYDAWGRLIGETGRDGRTVSLEWDGLDRMISRRDQAGGHTQWVYEANHELVRHADGRRDEFRYAGGDVLIEASNSTGKLRYEWNAAGLTKTVHDEAAGIRLAYGRDRSGRVVRVTGAGRDIRRAYGKNGELTGVEDTALRLFASFRYDRDGFELERSYGNGVKQLTRHDRNGLPSASALWSGGALLDAESLVRDEYGRITHRYSIADGLSVFRYDSASRLSSRLRYGTGPWHETGREARDTLAGLINSVAPGRGVSVPAGFPANSVSWGYDGNGNISSIRGEQESRRVYDSEDRLVAEGDTVFGWDERGNLVREKSLRFEKSYVYNSSNRLEKVTVTDSVSRSACSTVYLYDPFGRLTLVRSDSAGPVRILYDEFSFDVLLEGPAFGDLSLAGVRPHGGTYAGNSGRYRSGQSPEGSPLPDAASRRYGLFAGGYEVASVSGSGERMYFSADHTGSVVTATGINGSVVHRTQFEPFGSPVAGSASTAGIPGFAGKRGDSQAGLINFGWRHYHPAAATWTSADPIRDGHNWYSYTANDPINHRDLFGLELLFYVNKHDQRMYIEYTHNGVTTYDSVEVVTRVVSKKNHPDRYLEDTDTQRSQVTGEGTTRPTVFPNGRYQITGSKPNPTGNSKFAGTWLTTNAQQELLDINTGERLLDGGYQIHFTELDQTNGCIGLLTHEDMEKLVYYFNENQTHSPGKAWIEVNENKRR